MLYAIGKCDGYIFNDGNGGFQLYPFTTENISGYINYFDLVNKSLLTVGNSGDQVINAILNGCKDITLLDINPYTKYYYYLKIASLLCLDIDTFMEFLRYQDYPRVFKKNMNVFKKEIYENIKSTLRLLDYESYLFWDELFQTYKPIDIRNYLFSLDENRTDVIIESNNYLRNEKNYNEAREKVKKVVPRFINGDLLNIDLNETFDNIWLSNIGAWLEMDKVKNMIDKMSKLLNEDSKLLISYLYRTTKYSKYIDEFAPIYDLKNTFKILKEYNPELFSFIGVDGTKFNEKNIKDSVLVYHKH